VLEGFDEAGNPRPVAQGSFAIYPMPDSGLMMVMSIADGPMQGTHHYRMPPGMIRFATSLVGGGKIKALRSMFRDKS